MTADKPANVPRRTVLGGLAAMSAAGCSRIAFMAANVPAAFGAYDRHQNVAFGADPQHRLALLEADVQDMFGPPLHYPDSQPINFVRSDAPPMLLVHGLRDGTVWPKNSRNLATALAARGVPVTLKLYSKQGHADTVAALSLPARGRAPTLADIAAFVTGRQAALAGAAGAMA